jgi:hypothetical protein
MPRKNTGLGLGTVFVVALALAGAFAGFLYWHSEQGASGPAEAPAEAPATTAAPAPAPLVPTPVPAPTPAPAAANAHPLDAGERLPLGGTSAVRYSVAGGMVTFQFDLAADEWPSIDVDVNRNGAIDPNLDRSYTISSNRRYCAQYITGAGSWSECGGAPSGGRVTVAGQRTRTVTFHIPAGELSTDPGSAYVTFKLCRQSGTAWQCSQSPGGSGPQVDFADVLALTLR